MRGNTLLARDAPNSPTHDPSAFPALAEATVKLNIFKKNKIFRYITGILLVQDAGSINVPDSQLGAVAD